MSDAISVNTMVVLRWSESLLMKFGFHCLLTHFKVSAWVLINIALLIPETAFAYLDPSSGNAIGYVLLSGFAVFLYSIQGLYYRIVSWVKGEESVSVSDQDCHEIVLFSEGKAYWITFKPVVEALIARKQPFIYYSQEVQDPGLMIEDPYMQPRYIGSGFLGRYKLNHLRANVLLSTMPNFGSPGYSISRSENIGTLLHVFHSVCDISMYRKGSLDHYDVVLLSGDFQAKSIREIEQKRGLSEKRLIHAGLPYLDALAEEMPERQKGLARDGGVQTVLIGSSWGSKGCLYKYGARFIRAIAEAGLDVIVRPHPQSFKSEPELLERIQKELSSLSAVSWDIGGTVADAMARSDILVSDTSSIRFDYAFLYEKPVITLEIETEKMSGFEIEDLDEVWINTLNEKIGYAIRADQIDQLPARITEALSNFKPGRIGDIRDSILCNYGRSGDTIAGLLTEENARLRSVVGDDNSLSGNIL